MDSDSRLILEAGKRAAILQRIRLHLATLGFPVDDLSDEEVESGLNKATALTAKCGVSADQAAHAMVQLASWGINPHSLVT